MLQQKPENNRKKMFVFDVAFSVIFADQQLTASKTRKENADCLGFVVVPPGVEPGLF